MPAHKSWRKRNLPDTGRPNPHVISSYTLSLPFSLSPSSCAQTGDKIGEAKMLTSCGEANSGKEGKAKARW